MDFFTYLDACIEFIISKGSTEVPQDINVFLTSELDKPQYPFLFANYFFNRDNFIQRKAALTFLARSLSKNIISYDAVQLQAIAESLENISLDIISKESDDQEKIDLLNFLLKPIIMLFSIVGVQWQGFFKIITLYENNIIYFSFCSNLMLELLDVRYDQTSQIILQFGTKLIHFGIFSGNFEYFFPSFRILLKSPIFEELNDCYQIIFQVAKDSFTIFKEKPLLLQQFWARLSNFRVSFENDRSFALIAMEFLKVLNSSISDESVPLEYDSRIAEAFIYYLCSHVDVLTGEDEIQLLLNSYVKFMKYLYNNSTSSTLKEDISILMKLFYFNCSPEQLKFSVSFFVYKINKYIFSEKREAGNEQEPIQNANTINVHYLIASNLFSDILSYHPKAALPYITSHFIPLIEKLIQRALEVYDLFSTFINSSICNAIDYYAFFERILNLLFTDSYSVRLGCYDLVISFGTHMNYLSGFIFPILIQNISNIRPSEFHLYLDCLYATFNPSLTFTDENCSKLLSFFESLFQNQNEEIRFKAAIFVFKLMIMHSHIFSSLFPLSLEILNNNPEDSRIYIAFRQYIQYYGLKFIENEVHDLFLAANNYLENEERFMCVAALLKYVPETRKSEDATKFYESIVVNSDLKLGEPLNLEMISHIIFKGKYFVIFFGSIHKEIRLLNSSRKDLLHGYCKISRKMLKTIPESVNTEDIARVIDTSFNFFLTTNIVLAAKSNTNEKSNVEPNLGLDALMQDTKFIIQNSSILSEFGMMLAMMHLDKVHVVTAMFLHLSSNGDYEILIDAMIFFEKVLINGQASEEEIAALIQFSAAALQNIRVDIHLNQLFNMISAIPPEIVISSIWGDLVDFFMNNQQSQKELQCSFSSLSAIICKYMSQYTNLFLPQVVNQCFPNFPPLERKKSMMFLEGIISFATNDFPPEIKANANSCILNYLSWNTNRTKFYKITDEMDAFIVSNFSNK